MRNWNRPEFPEISLSVALHPDPVPAGLDEAPENREFSKSGTALEIHKRLAAERVAWRRPRPAPEGRIGFGNDNRKAMGKPDSL